MTCFDNYARRLLNLPLLYVHYHLWRVHPRRLIHTRYGQSIDRPIFLLGVQGGGLTLVARMLRRHPYAVSVTGNSTYWAGPDEMQNVMGPYLPGELTGVAPQLTVDEAPIRKISQPGLGRPTAPLG